MNCKYLGVITIVIAVFMVLIPVSATFEVRTANEPISTIGFNISKQNVLEKFNTVKESPVFSQYLDELSRYRSTSGTSQTSAIITDSVSSYGYCSTCSGVSQYSVINHYLTGPIYYPNPVQSIERGYGSLVVSGGPDSGGPYYLWVKPLFFATDVEDYYDMQWHICGKLPVNFDNNILSGEYCLKVTTKQSSNAKGAWCGTAIVVPNQTTTVTVPSYLSGCPLGCNNCC